MAYRRSRRDHVGRHTITVAETDARRPLAPEAARVAGRAPALALLDGELWPRSVAAAAVRATWITEEPFLWGLDRFLDGLATALR